MKLQIRLPVGRVAALFVPAVLGMIQTVLLSTFSILSVTCAQAQSPTPVLQLKAANYNPSTGLWIASIGANAQASGTLPTLAPGVTPNGSPAVVFNGANPMALASSIPAANGYTAIAFIEPATGAGPYALFGGAAGAFEYRIYQGKQDALRQQQADLGSESTALSTSAFSIIAVTVTNSGGGGFWVDGTADGNNSPTSFTSAIGAIGARASGGGEDFSGSISEIDIYPDVLTTAQISAVEEAMTNSYITVAPTPFVQLVASNYNPASGIWTDSSGNNNTATYAGGSPPTLDSFVTPNGAAVVNLTGSGSLLLASSLAPDSGYTVFAYIEPSSINANERYALTGGSSPTALEYDIYNGKQDYLSEYTADLGEGNASIPITSFSLVDLAVNSSGASFRYNGSTDGSVSGSSFGSPITRIGNNEGGGDGFAGNIAEIDIYSGVLSAIQISNVEAQLTGKYVTANSVVIGPATISPANSVYAGTAVTLAASVIGGTGTTTYQWQTDNGSGGASFANISGATTTNYVLNTTLLQGTYEYQLVGTPFGGSPVTGAPVTLTVQSASSPVVLSDTTANPSVASIGGDDTLSASFTGTLPIGGYQWLVSANSSGSGAVTIPGATNATLVLTNLQLADSGNYYSLLATNAVSPFFGQSSWLQITVQPLSTFLDVQLVATNYDPSVGIWADSSGNNNTAAYFGGSTPTLLAFVTPNGGSAVNLTGSGSLVLASFLDPSSGYTVFAYIEPSGTSGRNALTGGTAPTALEYDVYGGHQDYLTEYTADIGHGNAVIPTTGFSLIDLAVNSSGASFRFNGASDGSVAGASFGQPIARIGNNEGGGDGFAGNIAEIDIYSIVLSASQISNVEAQLTAKYVTVNSIVIGTPTVSPTNYLYAGTVATLAASVIGGTGTTTYQWQTDNGSGGASFVNISGATTTNYSLNTATLQGTYEYRLVGTPFGGSSVAGASVTLEVQPASAPVVLSDTTANPSVAMVGGNDTLSASFTGTLPIGGYQWLVSANPSGSGAVNIAGATNTTLVFTNLQLSDSGGYYSLQATNAVSPYVGQSSWLQLTVQPLTALVQLVATNYDPSSGIWTDSSGNNNNAIYGGSSTPTLVSAVTPNGGSAVNVTGAGSLVLASPLDQSSGYTVFAYIEPSSTSGRHALTGGSAPTALEYDVFDGNQDYLTEYTADIGHGNAVIPTSSFSLIDLAVNSSKASFRLNGASDGNVSGASFGSPISRIGNNEGGGDGFAGNIAEIDVYGGVLSPSQISKVEAQLTTSYGNFINLNPTNITGAVIGGTNLQLSWPGDHTGWTLEAQTNNVGLTTNWVRVADSAATNVVSIPISTANTCVFYRLVYP